MDPAMAEAMNVMKEEQSKMIQTAQDGWNAQGEIWGKKLKDMENLVKDVEENLKAKGAREDRTDDKIKVIEEEVKKLAEKIAEEQGGKAKSAFNHKGANQVKPSAWDDTVPFMDLTVEIRTWAKTLHKEFRKLIEMAEDDPGEYLKFDNEMQAKFPEFVTLDQELWNMLSITVKGPAKGYVLNPAESGFQAWAQLVQHFDPRSSVDRTVAYGRIVDPISTFG